MRPPTARTTIAERMYVDSYVLIDFIVRLVLFVNIATRLIALLIMYLLTFVDGSHPALCQVFVVRQESINTTMVVFLLLFCGVTRLYIQRELIESALSILC